MTPVYMKKAMLMLPTLNYFELVDRHEKHVYELEDIYIYKTNFVLRVLIR